jgi:hypothetical protein
METLLWLSMYVCMLLIAALPWLIKPTRRVLEYELIGFVLEYQVFGFFMPWKYMSRRKHRLEREVSDLKEKLKKATKELDDEQKLLEKQVELLQSEYRNHLYDINGKRSWRYLWTQPPILDRQQLEVREKEKKQKEDIKKGRVATYTLPPQARSTGFQDDVIEAMGKSRKKLWFYTDPKNQAMLDGNNNRSKNNKGGNQQQNNQQQQNN